MAKTGIKKTAADANLWGSFGPKLAAILDATSDAIAVLGNDLRIETANAAFRTMWPLPASLLATHPSLEDVIRHPSGHQLLSSDGLEASLKAIKTVDEGLAGAEIRRDDGKILVRQCHPLPGGGYALVYAEVTESVRSTEIARTQELRYRHALQAADQSFWEWNLFTDEIRITQRFWLQIHRTDIGPTFNFSDFMNLVHADDREFLRETCGLMAKAKNPTWLAPLIFSASSHPTATPGNLPWVLACRIRRRTIPPCCPDCCGT